MDAICAHYSTDRRQIMWTETAKDFLTVKRNQSQRGSLDQEARRS